MAFEHIDEQLQARRGASLFRERRCIEAAEPRRINVDGHWYLNFSSNDYLGLAQSDALKQAAADAAATQGVGSGASPLVSGHSRSHKELEDYLCEALGRDRVLLFNSGFSANQALIQTLVPKDANVIADRLCHASMLDGALASGARLKRYTHNDMEHLSRLLSQSEGDCLVMTEGVFSMDGDQAPIKDILRLCQRHQALAFVDDAHGFGVLGAQGLGSAELHGADQASLPLLMATFGKAIGTSGAFAATTEMFYDYLVNFARHYIYSTAMSPLMAAITLRSLRLVREESWRREKLQQNIQLFKTLSAEHGLSLMPSDTAIQPLLVGEADRALTCAEDLRQAGFFLVAIRPPTVPDGQSRLRVTLSAAHQGEDIKQLVQAIARKAQDGA
ncbi:8-amino-7-oxononanoate synthase [Aliiglaciecola sp. CAU 1673]|uniref:8-amino-7-oxononanoate synthase n=1 Tax=Aliiglaciecola sp. CAU 1673 TaxID=3032595 RepID=UPI0023DB7F08|nr:8-amino-7-oxononanoate synthase [Aliiglaciecola sp. CAU 1673]MDF2179920.1 8-amino-7-oxononanoate synthase [Aliiglaciecola sp. CAU 1673]